MASADVARALNDILSNVPKVNMDPGYILAFTGFLILAIFGVALAGLLIVRSVKAVANMTPERFVAFTAIVAVLLIVAAFFIP